MKSSGAAHEINLLHHLRKQGKNITGIQVRRSIKDAHGEVIGERIDDIIEDLGGGLRLLHDAKAWKPENIKDMLYESLKTSVKKVDGNKVKDEYGQLYKDIVDMWMRGKFDVRWNFDHRVLDAYGGDVAKFQDDVAEWIVEGIESPGVKAKLMSSLRLSDKIKKSDRSWNNFIETLEGKLIDFAQVTSKYEIPAI